MPRPRVVVHASISIDGCMTGFAPDLAAHYEAAAAIPAQARLIGSVTMATGLDAFGRGGGDPEASPKPDDPTLPYWVLVDSTARLEGRLHEVRTFPGVREVLVLVSYATPDGYLQYLARHRYPYLMTGTSHVDLVGALGLLGTHWNVERILVDAGPSLTSALLDAGLVDEVSLLVHPVVAGSAGRRLFESAAGPVALKLVGEAAADGLLHLRYGCEDNAI